jgi:hypothetical protein
MKTSSKLILGLAIILAAVCWYTIRLSTKTPEKSVSSPIAELKKKEIETEAKQISTEVSKNGLQHTVFKIVKEMDQSALDKVSADLLDTVAALGIARDKIKQITVVASSLEIKNQKLERKISALATTYSHTDNYATLSVNVPKDSLIGATFSLAYNADLSTTQYRKKTWLFGQNNSYIDIYSNDPRVTIKGVKTLTIKEKPSAFDLKLQANTSYNFETGLLGVGPAVRVDLGRFSIQGRYSRYPNNSKWQPSVNASYDILRF